MKLRNIIAALSGLLALVGLTGCDGEKDLIIIDEDLPIKTETLYMMGDATPNGWSADAPTPLIPSVDDPLIFTWEGPLNEGEMKLCMTTGSFDVPFIRPLANGDIINKDGKVDEKFTMHAGDPDDKWRIGEAGIYNLRFDLRNWLMSATYVGEQEAPVKEPIVTDVLYIVGSATPVGWNIDAPFALEKVSDYIFTYNGPLTPGELKACMTTGDWNAMFIRPTTDGRAITKEGINAEDFAYSVAPDNKWVVEEAGIYSLTFDLENWTFSATYEDGYETTKLYMIGDATAGGWSLDDATVIEATADNNKIFVWEGELKLGTFKAAEVKDFNAPFYRPATPNCEVSASGVASQEMVFTESPDDQWMVTTAGKYRLTFNTVDMVFDAVYLDGAAAELPVLYMIGDATIGGWSLDDATEITATSENLYVWEGVLNEGSFKASFAKSFDDPFYRPTVADCEVSENGVASPDMVLSTSPDDKWKVTKAGKYQLTFNLTDMLFDAVYLGEGAQQVRLFMIGDATAGGWSLDNATELTAVDGIDGEFTWTGHLAVGTFKACTIKDFSAPFYRPSTSDCTVSAAGISATDMVYTTDPDDKWNVTTAGEYKLTLNINAMTIYVEYLN